MRIKELSDEYYTLRKKMKRARRLYVLICKRAIETEKSIALHRAALKAMEIGLWRTIYINDVKYAILRLMCAIDHGKGAVHDHGRNMVWWDWCNEHKWGNYGGWGYRGDAVNE